MTHKLLFAGFDALYVAFAGALRPEEFDTLEKARDEAQKREERVLTKIGPGQVDVYVLGHGGKGGYAFIIDTGPLGGIWKFKHNTDASKWNIFVEPSATMLLAYDYIGTRDKLWEFLDSIGATITDHSINRVDFAMDFQTQGFELHQEQFVAHSHTKVAPHWGKKEKQVDLNQPSAVLRGRRLESVTIGKLPGRQIIVYDKRRQAIEIQKYFWFKVWKIDRHDQSAEVWRLEIRAGKKELKNKYQIRTFDDLEASIGDVVLNTFDAIKYLNDQQSDTNVSRQTLHPLWRQALVIATQKLTKFRSGLTPGQIVEIKREHAVELYLNLCFGNGIGLGIASGLSDEEINKELPSLIEAKISNLISSESTRLDKSISRTRDRLHFLNEDSA